MRPDPAQVLKEVNWDLWLGPAAYRPFKNNVYHAFAWRGWYDFGTGALGDMACHTVNMPFRALKMGYPTVAVYSEPDRSAMHVAYADQAMPVGAAPSRESYLRIDAMLDAIHASGALHRSPGRTAHTAARASPPIYSRRTSILAC